MTERIIGGAIEVHRYYGPGLLESVYEEGLLIELRQAGINVARQRQLPVFYKGHRTNSRFRLDLLIDETVIVEVKHIEKILPVHEAQVLSYLKHTNLHVGLLFNFKVVSLRDGIRRISN
ncbi:MAG: GxxExxY protein [Gemmatimonadales bacterium]